MARTNYQYEKRQRDLEKKKKKEEKRQKKLNKKLADNVENSDSPIENVETSENQDESTDGDV